MFLHLACKVEQVQVGVAHWNGDGDLQLLETQAEW